MAATRFFTLSSSLGSFLVLAILFRGAAAAEAESEAGSTTSSDCQQRLNAIFANYTNPAVTPAGCDAACLNACYVTLEDAIYATFITDCPLQADITRCFGYFANDWEEYVEHCELFTVDTSGLPAGSTSESEAEAGATPVAADSEAEAEAEAAAPAPAAAESEAEAGATRRLLAEGEAESEAAKTSGAGVCFPSFKSEEEFDMYLNGEYFELAYNPPSNTAGVIMSVFFWVGLAGMGFYLRK